MPSGSYNQRQRRARGFTLVELMLTLVVSTVIMGGLSAAIMIATRAVETTPGPAVNSARGHEAATWIERDLLLAEEVTIGPREVTLTVPDRDAPSDERSEIIRYSWSGEPGAPLLRRYNDDPLEAVVDDVHAFGVTPRERTASGAASDDAVVVIAPETWGYFDGASGGLSIAVLLVVRDSDDPEPEVLAQHDLLESWGATVTMVEQDASPAEYESAIGGADVVLVTEACNKFDVIENLNDRPLGLVNQSKALAEDLGFATAVGDSHGTDLHVDDNEHPITQGLSTGMLTILDSPQRIVELKGDPAIGLRSLAGASGFPALAILDAGAGRVDGTLAPSRRAALPFGKDFDVTLLNTEGLSIFRRTLAWAAEDAQAGSFGALTAFGTPVTDVKRIQIATRATLDEPGVLLAFRAYIDTHGKSYRMALYADDGGEPGTLLAESPETEEDGIGWKTALAPSVALSPGDYWLALAFDNREQVYFQESGGATRYRVHDAVGDGFLPDWGSSNASYGIKLSIYATYAPDN